MTGGVAVLKVGAATETEMKETKARVDDALNATRAAMAEGVVAGGVTLLRAREVLKQISEEAEGDRAIGINLVYDALSAPTWKISENAGVDGDEVIKNILQNEDEDFGFNARTGEYVNMVENGILDPAKVTRNALESAGSIAGLVLTTGTLIADDPELKEAAPSMPDMGGMGGMGGTRVWALNQRINMPHFQVNGLNFHYNLIQGEGPDFDALVQHRIRL